MRMTSIVFFFLTIEVNNYHHSLVTTILQNIFLFQHKKLVQVLKR